MNTKKTILVCALAAAFAGPAAAGDMLAGDAAAAKFPAVLQGMGLRDAKWMQLTNGVEYYYGRFSDLLGTVDGFTGSKNDLHMLRIDYARSPVKMKFVDHTQTSTKRWTTSKTAAQHGALFAVNMTMEDGNDRPQGYAKADGAVIPNGSATTGVKDGFAFNDDKTYRFDKDWTAVDAATGRPKADAWDNVVTHEAYTIHGGVATWGASATYFSKANYTFFGTTADGVLWACAVDGRCADSEGLGYHEVAALQLALGCVEGVCCDGGGSTTMAIRKDLMTVSDVCATQKASPDAPDYYTMNYLSGRTVFGTNIGAGTERAVINQLLFVPDPSWGGPFGLGEAAARPGIDYDGSTVTVALEGAVPDGAAVSAKVTIGGVDYAGTVGGGSAVFEIPAGVVTAGNAYDGVVAVTVDGAVYTKAVRLVQGRLVVDENAGWIRESAASFGTTGAWSGDRVAVEDGAIAVSNATFEAASPSPQNAIVTVASTFDFVDANDDAFDPSALAGVKVVKVDDVRRYAFLTGDGVVTNLDAGATVGSAVAVTVRVDFAENRLSYSVGGEPFGPFPAVAGAARVSGAGYAGATSVASLDGSYRLEEIDANLAKIGDTEYATVADAFAAGGDGVVTLLWDSSWVPTVPGEYVVATNGHAIVVGGDLVCEMTDNDDGTVTITLTDALNRVRAFSISVGAAKVRVGVAGVKKDCWYALEKTTDLAVDFAVDESTWTKGSLLLDGDSVLEIALGENEPHAFYRVVESDKDPNP